MFAILPLATACGPSSQQLPDAADSEGISDGAIDTGGNEKIADNFKEVDFTANQANEILKSYSHLDPSGVVPTNLLRDAVLYFHKNKAQIQNQKYLVVIDYAVSSKNKRLNLVNIENGSVWSAHVAHGKGSDANHDGFAEKFSNTSGSNATSLGYFLTAETYTGSNGFSLRLDGLSKSNSNARSRAIVMHGASYVQDSARIQGRSWGCPAVAMEYHSWLINLVKGGTLIYSGLSNAPSATPKPTATPVPTPVPTPKPTPATMLATPLWEAKATDGKLWTAHVMKRLDTLGSALLKAQPSDAATFCPKFKSLTQEQRKQFYTYLISAMTRYESNFTPSMSFKEGFDDSDGNPVISRGLLQISIESGNAYGCGFRNTNDLHNPYLNLDCGIRILNRWIGERDLRIAGKVGSKWRGGARYWSVLRTTSGSYNSIVSLAKGTDLCR